MISWEEICRNKKWSKAKILRVLQKKEKGFIAVEHVGIKDKNGVDIYKSDFVRIFMPGSNQPKVSFAGVCIFDENSVSFVIKGSHQADWYLWKHLAPFLEVVGNAFETPNLLKSIE